MTKPLFLVTFTSMNFFLLPGNPPAAHFYQEWGHEINAHLPVGKVRVSHYPDMMHFRDSNEAMKFVLESHLRQLLEFHEEVQSPITLIGHSLGAYFCLGLIQRVPELIDRAIFIHPFLRSPDRMGQFILQAAASLYHLDKLQKLILRSRKALEYYSPELTYVTKEEILRSFHLARHEKATIGKDRSPIYIREDLRTKISVFYTHGDTWCRKHTINELKNQVRVIECSEPHGFVTSKNHRQTLFGLITTIL